MFFFTCEIKQCNFLDRVTVLVSLSEYLHRKKVSDIPAGDGNVANLFLQCRAAEIVRLFLYKNLNNMLISYIEIRLKNMKEFDLFASYCEHT